MEERAERIRAAFAAYSRGDLEPFTALLDPEATWIGIADPAWGTPT